MIEVTLGTAYAGLKSHPFAFAQGPSSGFTWIEH